MRRARAFLLKGKLVAVISLLGALPSPPPYSQACDFLIASCKDNKRFGLNDWQEEWDGTQEEPDLLKGLSDEERAQLKNVPLQPQVTKGEIGNMLTG